MIFLCSRWPSWTVRTLPRISHWSKSFAIVQTRRSSIENLSSPSCRSTRIRRRCRGSDFHSTISLTAKLRPSSYSSLQRMTTTSVFPWMPSPASSRSFHTIPCTSMIWAMVFLLTKLIRYYYYTTTTTANLGEPIPALVLILHLFRKRFLRISGTMFLRAGCPLCHPTTSVKALKGTQSTNINQWPVLVLSS